MKTEKISGENGVMVHIGGDSEHGDMAAIGNMELLAPIFVSIMIDAMTDPKGNPEPFKLVASIFHAIAFLDKNNDGTLLETIKGIENSKKAMKKIERFFVDKDEEEKKKTKKAKATKDE